MEYLLYQALNSLICISSAKQISAQAMTQLGKYGYCFYLLPFMRLWALKPKETYLCAIYFPCYQNTPNS